MHRWKVAGGLAPVVAAVAALAVLAPGVSGQGRPAVAPRAEREARVVSWFGSQIGVTVKDAETSGVIVDDVRTNSPAEKAGVKEGDVIVEFDGERVRSSRQFSRLVDESAQGRSVKMAVQRNGQRTSLDVTPEARQFGRVMPIPLERFHMPELPEIPAAPMLRDFDSRLFPDVEIYTSRPGRLGVQVEDLEDQLAEYFGVKRGALITSVSKDTPGARAGLKAGDVITKIGEESIENTRDIRREIRRIDAGKEFTVEVMRERKPLSVKVTLDPPASSQKPGTATEWY
jgi:S1-C subfamily serine protease